MVQIGVRGHDYGRDTPEKLFGKIHADGFTCLQLAIKKAVTGVENFEDITPEVISTIKAALEKEKMTVAVLGCYIEPSLVDDKLRKKNVDEFLGSIPIAKELGAVCIGTETTPMVKQPGVTRKEALHCLFDSVEKFLTVAEDKGVNVAIEPVFTHALYTPELARELLDTMKSDNLRIIFDPVNVFSKEALGDQHSLWDRCFDCFGDKIAAVHLKGIRLDESREIVACDYKDSILDYKYIFKGLSEIPQKFNVMREEVNPKNGKSDRRFIADLLGID